MSVLQEIRNIYLRWKPILPYTYCRISPGFRSSHPRRVLLQMQTCNSSSSDIQLPLYSVETTISGSWCT